MNTSFDLLPLNSVRKILASIGIDDSNALICSTSKNEEELLLKIKAIEKKLQDKWVTRNSDNDFSIYSDETYFTNLILSYVYYSSNYIGFAIEQILQYAKNTHKQHDALKIYEDYPGFGLSTLHLCASGFKNISIFNDVPCQIEWMKRVFAESAKTSTIFKLPDIFVKRPLDEKYDVVLSFECAEHYQQPIEYVKQISSLVKSGGMLGISATYRYFQPKGNYFYSGHWPKYTVNGKDFYSETETLAAMHGYLTALNFEKLPNLSEHDPRLNFYQKL
jgi:SAM-dependent methyltransferase